LSPDQGQSKSLKAYPLRLKHQLGERLYKRRIQKDLVREVKHRLNSGVTVRLVVGAGPGSELIAPTGSVHEGWILTDHATLNALDSRDWAKEFEPGTISRIFAEHVVEHWTEDGLKTFLHIVSRYLNSSGNVRIAVPDGYHPDQSYIEQVKPGGTGPGSDDHKVLYNYQSLTAIFKSEDWEYDLLEYFDQEHKFHSKSWDKADGFIERAAETDSRNNIRPLSYTSLILDARPRTPKK